jgi:hypothetical protein
MQRTGDVSYLILLAEGSRSTAGGGEVAPPEEGLACVRLGSPSGELFSNHPDSNEKQLSLQTKVRFLN